MIRISPLSLLSACLILGPGAIFANDAESISLSPDNWQAASSAKLSDSSGGLKVKSLESSIWFGPTDRIAYQGDDVVSIHYSLRGGNLVVQANWFDEAGNFLETVSLGKSDSSREDALFRVVQSDATSSPSGSYEIKFWIEADMPSLVIHSLSIRNGVDALPLLTTDDLALSDSITVSPESSGLLRFTLQPDLSTGNILTTKRLSRNTLDSFLLRVTSVSPESAFSVQAIFWSADGTYLGDRNLLTDITDPQDVLIDKSGLSLPDQTASIGFKFWLSGNGASAVAGVMAE